MVLDEIGKHFLEHAVELVKSGKKFVYVVDNVDWEERVHDMRAIHQNKSVLQSQPAWFLAVYPVTT